MKKWIIAATALVFATLGAVAQQKQERAPQTREQRAPQTPEQRAQAMTDRMAEKLSLTDAQKKEIYQINLENTIKRQKEMEAQMAEREAKQAEMKAQEEKIKNVLTEEQRKQWEEIKLERKNQRRPGGQVHDRSEIRRSPHRGDNSGEK
ncbi:MAG: DUF4890 domain-containing protein [Cyclobacteriaceae bacterium]|nr:DUF4890 domain-containing protein [Cyclobacteriaceae bacterium]